LRIASAFAYRATGLAPKVSGQFFASFALSGCCQTWDGLVLQYASKAPFEQFHLPIEILISAEHIRRRPSPLGRMHLDELGQTYDHTSNPDPKYREVAMHVCCKHCVVDPSTCIRVGVFHRKKIIVLLGLCFNSSHCGTCVIIVVIVLRYSISPLPYMVSETQIPTPWQARHRPSQATSLHTSAQW